MQVDINTNLIFFRDDFSKRGAVFIERPSISANKRKDPAWTQERKAFFNKSYIQISAVIDGFKPFPIFGLEHGGNLFNSYIGRVPDNNIIISLKICKKGVALMNPRIHKAL